MLASCCVIATNFGFTFSLNEITTTNNQSWISIHYYVVEGLKHAHVLFTLEWLMEGEIATNIQAIIFML
jgi:hypothetical protein